MLHGHISFHVRWMLCNISRSEALYMKYFCLSSFTFSYQTAAALPFFMRYYIGKMTHWTATFNTARVIISLLHETNSAIECHCPFTCCCMPRGQIPYTKSKEKSILKWCCVQHHTIKKFCLIYCANLVYKKNWGYIYNTAHYQYVQYTIFTDFKMGFYLRSIKHSTYCDLNVTATQIVYNSIRRNIAWAYFVDWLQTLGRSFTRRSPQRGLVRMSASCWLQPCPL